LSPLAQRHQNINHALVCSDYFTTTAKITLILEDVVDSGIPTSFSPAADQEVERSYRPWQNLKIKMSKSYRTFPERTQLIVGDTLRSPDLAMTDTSLCESF